MKLNTMLTPANSRWVLINIFALG